MVSFHTADYVIGSFIMLVPVVIGLYFAVRDKNRATREEYLMGGRQMALLPVALSVFITFASAVSQIGIPVEVYSYGSEYIVFSVGLALAFLVCLNTMIPLIYPLKLTSMYEYLQMRYRSTEVRLLCTCIGILATTCYMSIALLSPALALQTSAGIPFWMSVALVGGIGTIYTTLGGIKSVIWTDAFQSIIVFVGLAAFIGKGVSEVGSVSEVWRISEEGGRTRMNSVSPDPRIRHTYLGCLVGCMFMWLVNCFNQSSVQRVCSMKTMRHAKISFVINFPLQIIYCTILVIFGNVVYAYFAKTQCDPYEGGLITNKNQMAPYFVLETMSDLPGMAGLYIATLCCGSLSTLSSGINAMAANTVEDLLAYPLRNVHESTATFITKMVVLVYGTLIIGLAYGARYLQGPVTQMAGSVFGALGSPVLGIYLVGASVPWANKYGALAGGVGSIVFNLWISVGSRLYGTKTVTLPPVTTANCFPHNGTVGAMSNFGYENVTAGLSSYMLLNHTTTVSPEVSLHERAFGFFFYDISYEWYSFIGSMVCVTVALIVSYITNCLSGVKTSTDPNLVFPFLRKFYGMKSESGFIATVSDMEFDMSDIKGSDSNHSKSKPL